MAEQPHGGKRINESQLFLSYQEPHGSVSSDTIARWIKCILKGAGINTSLFTAHSIRSASSSKAFDQGANLEDKSLTGNLGPQSLRFGVSITGAMW